MIVAADLMFFRRFIRAPHNRNVVVASWIEGHAQFTANVDLAILKLDRLAPTFALGDGDILRQCRCLR